MWSCVRLNPNPNPNPIPPWGCTGTALACNAVASSSSSSSSWRRPWLADYTLLMDLGRAAAASARAQARASLKLSSHSNSTCFTGRGAVPVAALGTDTGYTNSKHPHGEEEEAEKDSDDSVTLPDQQLCLQQQKHNAKANAASIGSANVEQQLQLLDSNSPSKPRRIALFVEPSPFACVSFLHCSLFLFLSNSCSIDSID